MLAGCTQNTQQNGGKGTNFGDQKKYIHSQEKDLYKSMDGGQTWQRLGTLPDTKSLGLLVDPAKPGYLLMYGTNGPFESQDNRATLQPAPDIKDGIQKAVLAGSTI